MNPILENAMQTMREQFSQPPAGIVSVPPLAAEIDRQRAQLTAIKAAYFRACADPEARIPTILMAAIEAARA